MSRLRIRHRGRRLARVAGAAGLVAAVMGAGIAPADASTKPGADNHGGLVNMDATPTGGKAATHAARGATTVSMPAPTGPYKVGTVSLHLKDTSRTDPYVPGHQTRELMVSLWYPTDSTTGHSLAPWMPSLTAAHYLAGLGVRAGSLTLPTTAGHVLAPVDTKAGKLPVLLYSTGLHSDRAMGTALVEDLASRGYLVVAVDHTHDANEVEFPGGRLETDTMPSNAHSSDTLAVRAADVKFVNNELGQIANGKNPDVDGAKLPTGLLRDVDMTKIGMFGWSLGGAAVATSMQADSRIDAGADLDGTFYGSATSENLSRPFMLFSSATHNRNDDSSWATFWSHLKGVRYDLKMAGSAHLTFSDNEVLLPQAANQLGLSQSQVQQTLGTIAPDRAIQVERTYLAAYFDQELLKKKSSLLSATSSSYPEISFVK